jgi:hypothetical protein
MLHSPNPCSSVSCCRLNAHPPTGDGAWWCSRCHSLSSPLSRSARPLTSDEWLVPVQADTSVALTSLSVHATGGAGSASLCMFPSELCCLLIACCVSVCSSMLYVHRVYVACVCACIECASSVCVRASGCVLAPTQTGRHCRRAANAHRHAHKHEGGVHDSREPRRRRRGGPLEWDSRGCNAEWDSRGYNAARARCSETASS